MTITVAAAIGIASSCPTVNAQIRARVIPKAPIPITSDHTEKTLSHLYFSGKFKELQKALDKVMSDVSIKHEKKTIHLNKQYVSISFLGQDPIEEKATIVRIVRTSKGEISTPPNILPGKSTVYDIFLSTDSSARYGSAWFLTAEADPLEEDLAKLAKTVLPAFVGIAEPMNFTFTERIVDGKKNMLFARVNVVEMPIRRASINVVSKVSRSATTGEALAKKAKALQTELWLRTRHSSCARTLADRLQRMIEAVEDTLVVGKDERKELREDIEEEARKVSKEEVCADESKVRDDGALSVDRAEAFSEVTTAFTSLVTNAPAPVAATHELSNVPYRCLRAGVVGGAMVTKHTDDHVVEDGEVQEKQLTGAVTAGVLHLHWPYIPGKQTFSWPERISLFGGLVLTPAAGFIAGASFRPIRGVGLQVSHAWLQVKLPVDNPVDGGDVLERGYSKPWILGISYDI